MVNFCDPIGKFMINYQMRSNRHNTPGGLTPGVLTVVSLALTEAVTPCDPHPFLNPITFSGFDLHPIPRHPTPMGVIAPGIPHPLIRRGNPGFAPLPVPFMVVTAMPAPTARFGFNIDHLRLVSGLMGLKDGMPQNRSTHTNGDSLPSMALGAACQCR